jgi:hypothetical protein
MFLLTVLWSFASPLFSVPDEPAHVVRAAAVARGQLVGTDRTGEGPDDACVRDVAGPTTGPVTCTYFHLPQIFAAGYGVPGCFTFTPDVTADCAPRMQGSTAVTQVASTAGSSPPLYYFLVGLPSLALRSELGVRLMRIASGALCAALLASAFMSARSVGRGRLAPAGVLVAATPMTFFLAGAVNPNGFEAAAAIGLWAAGAALVTGADDARLPLRAAVAALALALTRPLSPLWVGLIGLALLGAAPLPLLRERWADRSVRLAVAGAVVGAGIGAAWLLIAKPLGGSIGGGSTLGTGHLLRLSAGATMDRVADMVGELGWLDTRPPALAVIVWLGLTGSLVVAAVCTAAARPAAVLLGLVVAVVAVPVAIEISQASRLGLVWQGRYSLPLAVGVPILGAALAGPLLEAVGRRMLTATAVATGVGHASVFWWGLRRYAVGVDHLFGPIRWSPPLLPAVALGAVFTLAVAAFSTLVVTSVPGER